VLHFANMRLQSVIGLLALTGLSSASLFMPGGNQDQISFQTDDDRTNPVAGDNPLEYCAPPDDYILQIDSVDLSPNPPEAGVTLSIVANGTLTQPIAKGAYVNLQVKYNNIITLIKQTVDLCDQVKNVDLDCPLDKGLLTITKDVDLPSQIPPGLYTVLADAFTVTDKRITCLTAKIHFNRS